jgi:hypothetical protein
MVGRVFFTAVSGKIDISKAHLKLARRSSKMFFCG